MTNKEDGRPAGEGIVVLSWPKFFFFFFFEKKKKKRLKGHNNFYNLNEKGGEKLEYL